MRLLLITTFASIWLTAALADEPVRFDFTLAGMPLGAMTVETDASGRDYQARMLFETTGVAGLLDYAFEGAATGTIDRAHAPRPTRFTATSRSPRATRHTVVDWSEGDMPLVTVDPPRALAVDPADAADAIDPVSALVLLGRLTDEPCGFEAELFDGSRLVRLTVGAPIDAGDVITCDGKYQRLGGEPITPVDPPKSVFQLMYTVGADGTSVLREIRIPTRLGQFLIARVS